MEVVDTPRDVETQEQPTKAEIFEHLFPGNKLKDLPWMNPLGGPLLFKRALLPEQLDDLNHAMDNEEGFARRVELPFLDQLSVAYQYINPTAIVQENAYGLRGWFSDLVKEGETIGGLTIQKNYYIPSGKRDKYFRAIVNPGEFVDWIRHGFRQTEDAERYLSSFFEPVLIKMVGILGSDGKPKAVIKFKEGPRPKHGEPVKNAKPVSNLVTTGVKI
mgnify:CR=1 FL=1